MLEGDTVARLCDDPKAGVDYVPFATCVQKYSEEAALAYDNNLADAQKHDMRADILRRSARFWQYLSHALNVVGVLLVMMKDLAERTKSHAQRGNP